MKIIVDFNDEKDARKFTELFYELKEWGYLMDSQGDVLQIVLRDAKSCLWDTSDYIE